ncbi:Type I restriction-modification system, specificity subunit S [Moraxella catarrhalis]|uniref:restriction endonuclease subunit S n=1 Tax=Moraxella catarrhalis TaxID=480 RepID=UPI0007E439BE|nr:restriction endonuclease subunit S [Moraxella catarrhalis]OAV27789.1 Type I restriction-modification system, specificity subunit S [Moraxella catarrhalis]
MAQHSFLENLLNGQAVEWRALGEVANYEQPTKYLVKSKDYDDDFKTPVLTAGKTFVLGYTNETNGIYQASKNPVIIFDDFTTANKWVDFDFKAKSSAMKMISSADENQFLLKYIYYWLNTLPSGLVDGDHKRQWISNFANKKIPIPPLSVQSQIVQILDTFTELTAELTAELSMRQKQYQYYRDFLLSEHELAKVGFEWKTLGEVGELVRGNGLTKKDLTDDGVPAIHYGQIYTRYGLSTEKTLSFVSTELAKRLRKVDTGDVVITNTSENLADVGKSLVYLGKEQAVTGGHATIFKPNKQIILGKYFAYFTQTDNFATQKRKYAKGTKVIDVSTNDMAKLKIPIPPLSVQSQIVAILDTFDTLTQSISDGLPKEIQLRQQQYEYYREQLLTFG